MKTKTQRKRTSQDTGAKIIKRVWGDLEVVDAINDLRVMILPEDVAKATPKDPGECVFAQACRRAFGASKVLFFRSVAYVEIPTEDGTPRIERFIMGVTMRKMIEDFDRGNTVLPKAGFLLRAPSPTKRLDKKQQEDREWHERARLLGKSTRGVGKYESEPIVIDLLVRSGSGAVHFIPKGTIKHRDRKKPRG